MLMTRHLLGPGLHQGCLFTVRSWSCKVLSIFYINALRSLGLEVVHYSTCYVEGNPQRDNLEETL